MDLQLKGKKALVTGSTAGIGLSTVKSLAGEGAKTIVNGRTAQSVDEAIARIHEDIPDAKLYAAPFDLSGARGIQSLVEKYPEVDILVNNLGIFEPKPFEDISDSDWMNFFETNVMSGVRLGRHYLQIMKRKNWGRIVFISSESGIQIPEEMIHYGMTKAAQIAVARGMAETTAGTNVTVNSILPGPTNSRGVGDFVSRLAEEKGISFDEMEREFFEKIRPTSLLQRFTEPSEIAGMVAFVCSPLSSAVNGAAIRVEGGVVRSMV